MGNNVNSDNRVVKDFGLEWSTFDQSVVTSEELKQNFNQYFSLFPWQTLHENARGFDLGCGSGRWARFVAPRVAELHCIDPSEPALNVARKNLADNKNCIFHLASVEAIPLANGSMDFGYSLGVLHHVPDTAKGIRQCVEKLKPGAPFLIYLYYAFDFRPMWFKAMWRMSDLLRRLISHSPFPVKYVISQVIALFVYYPFARAASVLERFGKNVKNIPLTEYRHKSFYTMRNDSLDRFGTRLEKRFTKTQIETMMREAGLVRISFSEDGPYWCALGYKE